jgi:hypothetical protein
LAQFALIVRADVFRRREEMLNRLQLVLGASLVCFPVPTVLGQVTFFPSDLSPGDEYRVAFITFSGLNALSSDIGDYNLFVTEQANQSGADTDGWGVNWFAIASTSDVDARDNIGDSTAPIYLLTDVRVADNSADLWDGSIQSLLSVNQFGDSESPQNVWTGTQSDGTELLGSALGTSDPRQGFSGVMDSGWVSFGNEPATALRSFYAISEVLVVPAPGALALLGLAGIAAPRRRRR